MGRNDFLRKNLAGFAPDHTRAQYVVGKSGTTPANYGETRFRETLDIETAPKVASSHAIPKNFYQRYGQPMDFSRISFACAVSHEIPPDFTPG